MNDIVDRLSEAGTDSRRRWIRAGLAGAATVLFVAGLLVASAVHTSAEEAVEDFFTALHDKDVDTALELVDGTIPYGPTAVFLHPDAIADLRLLDVVENPDSPGDGHDKLVDVLISSDGRSETRTVRATRSDDDWKLADPFVTVELGPTPTGYLRVNDRTVELPELYAGNPSRWVDEPQEYPMFPGPAVFFDDLAGAANDPSEARFLWPAEEDTPLISVDMATVEFTEDVQEQTQRETNRIIDDCATSTIAAPPDCPFMLTENHYTETDTDIQGFHDVTWTVDTYPAVRLADSGGNPRLAFEVQTADPGKLRMTGIADTADTTAEVEAECECDTHQMTGFLAPDGTVSLDSDEFGHGLDSEHSLDQSTCAITDLTFK